MTEIDDSLREQVSRAWRRAAGEDHPPFQRTWSGARDRRTATQQRYRRTAGVAAVAAAIAVGVNFMTPKNEPTYIEAADLLESTYWSAPSDVLLPDPEFDIYQDMPVIFESTEPAGGALL